MYTIDQIRKAGKDGEINSIDVEHLISLLPTEEVEIKEDDKIDLKKLFTESKLFKNTKKNYVPSDKNNEGASLASHSCTIGNSIEQLQYHLNKAMNALKSNDVVTATVFVDNAQILLNSDMNVQVSDTTKA